MRSQLRALILCQRSTADQIRNDVAEKLKRYGIRPVFHDETSLSRDIWDITSEIEVVDFLVVPNDNIHPDFIYEIGYARGKYKPILFIPSHNKNEGLYPQLKNQVIDVHEAEDPRLTLLSPKIKKFVRDVLSDNKELQIMCRGCR
jgi:hypothetical protein